MRHQYQNNGLEHVVNQVAIEVLGQLKEWVPNKASVENPLRVCAATILGSFVIRQAFFRLYSSTPLTQQRARVSSIELTSLLTEKLRRAGIGDVELVQMIKRTTTMTQVQEVQFWMIPLLLERCGIQPQRAKKLQNEVIQYLEALASKIVLPTPVGGYEAASRSHGDEVQGQKSLNF